ncbi:glycoside hydrolase family 51 protein [[Candida] arabinofermentans NRRL YB-2248]|uniref:non-reducing end alpha-L-arabinofuranosidase n=1 Tax=[Candida] arabinofermentans NRRL YB-2248 TaxID=983967 RepID=A0A1E4T722_9ASCO|nr:glycoside hydrolase family 51 protein [[Candida] arabinofermentans NRRL YB-2248]
MSSSNQTISEVSDLSKSEIRIDLNRTIAPVDTRIYSGFIEHLGRCIYGGVVDYDNEDKTKINEKGYRVDVLEAIQELEMPVIRWPGGNFVSNYHWEDGIGPLNERKIRPELAWSSDKKKFEEPNSFGTDEFLQYCEDNQFEPYLCLNMGTGTLQEALAWVEYCNGDGNTYYANLRRKNGRDKPWNVKYWGLGNEMWGEWQICARSKEDYANLAFEWAKAIKVLDQKVQLISCGCTGYNAEWDYHIIMKLAKIVDFHSIHIYTSSSDYYKNVTSTAAAEQAIQITSKLIDLATINYPATSTSVDGKIIEKPPIKICFDEWNVWDPVRADGSIGCEEQYTLSDALAVGSWLNVFIRQCQSLGMCNIAQLVNVIAPIMSKPDGLFLQTTYHPLKLFCKYMKNGDSLNLHVKTPLYKGPTGNDWDKNLEWATITDKKITMLDTSAILKTDTDKTTIYLAVVNRSLDQDSKTKILFNEESGSIKEIYKWEVYHDDVKATNTYDKPDVVGIVEEKVEVSGTEYKVELEFKKHSFTLVKLVLE